MALRGCDIRNLFFKGNQEIATINDELLQKFIDACDNGIRIDQEALDAARNMIPSAGKLEGEVVISQELLSVLASHDHTGEKVAEIIVKRTKDANDLVNIASWYLATENILHLITESNIATDDVYRALIDNNNGNIRTSDLASIAKNFNSAADLHNIVNHGNSGPESDKAVISNKHTKAEDLETIANRSNSAEDLHKIVAHKNHTIESDKAVISNKHTKAEDLEIIANRSTNNADLMLIAQHKNNNQASHMAVINNTNININILKNIAANTDSKEILSKIMNQDTIPRDNELDSVIIDNINTAEDILVLIAAKRGIDENLLKKITIHDNAGNDTFKAVIHSLKTPAGNSLADKEIKEKQEEILMIIAFRTKSPEILSEIVAHNSHTHKTDMAVVENSNTANKDLVIISKRTNSTNLLHSIAVHRKGGDIALNLSDHGPQQSLKKETQEDRHAMLAKACPF